MEGEGGVPTVGDKGNPLSAASVFYFSRNSNVSILRIDPCALSRLSSSSSANGGGGGVNKFQLQIPSYLIPEEVRASLLVFLNRLILSSYDSSPPSPCIASACFRLLDVLNGQDDFAIETLDDDESGVVRNCWSDAPVIAICALLDYESSALSTVADVVASFSCYALKADSLSFSSFTDSGDGFSDKDSVSVATDLKILLNDSKLLGNGTSLRLLDIPTIHCCLRSATRSIHTATRVRVQLNNSPIPAAAMALGRTLSALGLALGDVGECRESSLQRLAWLVDNNRDNNLIIPGLVQSFNSNCPTPISLEDISLKSYQAACVEKDYVKSAHLIHCLRA